VRFSVPPGFRFLIFCLSHYLLLFDARPRSFASSFLAVALPMAGFPALPRTFSRSPYSLGLNFAPIHFTRHFPAPLFFACAKPLAFWLGRSNLRLLSALPLVIPHIPCKSFFLLSADAFPFSRPRDLHSHLVCRCPPPPTHHVFLYVGFVFVPRLTRYPHKPHHYDAVGFTGYLFYYFPSLLLCPPSLIYGLSVLAC